MVGPSKFLTTETQDQEDHNLNDIDELKTLLYVVSKSF